MAEHRHAQVPIPGRHPHGSQHAAFAHINTIWEGSGKFIELDRILDTAVKLDPLNRTNPRLPTKKHVRYFADRPSLAVLLAMYAYKYWAPRWKVPLVLADTRERQAVINNAFDDIPFTDKRSKRTLFIAPIKPGTTMEKSIDGLVRTLLFTMLHDRPELITIAFEGNWNANKDSPHSYAYSFEIDEIHEGFKKLIEGGEAFDPSLGSLHRWAGRIRATILPYHVVPRDYNWQRVLS